MDSISGVGVVDKVVAVLRALEANGPLSLIELQDATGMPRATAHRLASALEDHGLVRREANGKFALGMGLVSMGKAASSALPLTEIARPVLDTLRTTTGESVQLYMREGEVVVALSHLNLRMDFVGLFPKVRCCHSMQDRLDMCWPENAWISVVGFNQLANAKLVWHQ